MQHTPSHELDRNTTLRTAREDVRVHGRILITTAAILEARGYNIANLENQLIATTNREMI
jgi:hypothetical protein